jgi:hypothetical protein
MLSQMLGGCCVVQVLGGVQDAAADAGATAGLMGCLMQAVLASPQADKLSQVGQLDVPHTLGGTMRVWRCCLAFTCVT